MATHPNGISAWQLRRPLSHCSDQTAWLICAKLSRSMLAPGRSLLSGLVEVDETEIACRSKNDPVTAEATAATKARCSLSAPSRCRTAASALAASA
jgi:hypothetical protein